MTLSSEKVILITKDNVEIYTLFRNNNHVKAAILLHMMPSTKESWDDFALSLDLAGYASVAIDERGHGESTMGGTLDYKNFTEEEQQAKMKDVETAFDFLLKRGFEEKNIVVVGASIGANLAIEFLSEHASVTLAIALSPGLNYRGVKTDRYINQLHDGQSVVLVASDDDDRDSAESTRVLHALNLEQTILIEKKNLGHGTTMLEKDPLLTQELIEKLP